MTSDATKKQASGFSGGLFGGLFGLLHKGFHLVGTVFLLLLFGQKVALNERSHAGAGGMVIGGIAGAFGVFPPILDVPIPLRPYLTVIWGAFVGAFCGMLIGWFIWLLDRWADEALRK
jgi:hypothetical protein